MLYYSHINEDSSIERVLLSENIYPFLIAVVGSGERVIALMDNKYVEKILAVDINAEALYLLELKLKVLQLCSPEDYLKFIGHYEADSSFRFLCFTKIKTCLTVNCRKYWEAEKNKIEKGIMNSGHFEKFLQRIRPLLNTFMGKKFHRILCQPERLNAVTNFKWKIVSSFFSKKWVYSLMGNRDVAFTGQGAAIGNITRALNNMIKEEKTHTSFISHLIFKGHLRDMEEKYLPPSLQLQVLTRIKERLKAGEVIVTYHQDDLLHLSRNNKPDRQAFYSASDILSFEDHAYLQDLIHSGLRVGGNCVVARSFLRNRISEMQLKKITNGYDSAFHDECESSGMYQVISINNHAT